VFPDWLFPPDWLILMVIGGLMTFVTLCLCFGLGLSLHLNNVVWLIWLVFSNALAYFWLVFQMLWLMFCLIGNTFSVLSIVSVVVLSYEKLLIFFILAANLKG
jgi:hypothetical protein